MKLARIVWHATMITVFSVTLAIGLWALASGAFAEMGTRYKERIVGWDIYDWVAQGEDMVDQCTMATTYSPKTKRGRKLLRASSMWFAMMADGRGRMRVIMASGDWNLTNEREYTVAIQFKGFPKQWRSDGFGFLHNSIAFNSPYNPKMIEQFMQAPTMVIKINDKTIGSFKLNGSSKAVVHWAKCMATIGKDTFESEGDTFGPTARDKDKIDTFGSTAEYKRVR